MKYIGKIEKYIHSSLWRFTVRHHNSIIIYFVKRDQLFTTDFRIAILPPKLFSPMLLISSDGSVNDLVTYRIRCSNRNSVASVLNHASGRRIDSVLEIDRADGDPNSRFHMPSR